MLFCLACISPARAQGSVVDETVYRFYAPSSMRDTARYATASCIIGAGEKSMKSYQASAQDQRPLTLARYCLSVFAVADAHKRLVTVIEFHRDTDIRSETAYAFAVGFGLGIADPAKYAEFTKASDQMIEGISEGCLRGQQQNRKDCSIAGALHAIRAERDLARLAAAFPSR